MADKIVLVFYGGGANDSIRGLMAEYGDALASIGLSVVPVTPDSAGLKYVEEKLYSGQVSFALTWLGFRQDLSVIVDRERPRISIWEALSLLVSRKNRRSNTAQAQSQRTNVWETFGVPLVKLHADLPAYFVDYHQDVPRNAVNLYAAAEFMHFRHRWLPEARTLAMQIPPLPLAATGRDELNLSARRSGKLVFLKNGNSPNALRQLWHERLPPSVARLVGDMADEITPIGIRPGILHIGDFVDAFLAARHIDPDSARYLVPFFTAQLDDYLRRIKSTMIAEAILDLPVIVQGSFWEHVDFNGRRAKLVEGQDFTTSQRNFSDQLGIIDMSPNMDTGPHDRLQRGAGSFCTVLTNGQTWFTDNFPELQELTFEFNPESIAARVADAIARPDRYIELGVEFGERFRGLYTREAFARRIVEGVDLASLQWNEEKPVIQPFFAWSGG